ncbi:MAG: hypothetical protein Q8P67_19435 [archaeon]|nr:hypothetical protein [archaeon]
MDDSPLKDSKKKSKKEEKKEKREQKKKRRNERERERKREKENKGSLLSLLLLFFLEKGKNQPERSNFLSNQ